jgi:glutaredoxin
MAVGKETGMRCPSCGYVRKPEDLAPEWQCPACQVVYEKAALFKAFKPVNRGAVAPSPVPPLPGGSAFSLKAVVTVALAGCILYFGHSFFSGVTITKETSNDTVEASPIVAPDKTVLLYSRAGCGYCDKAKRFLQKHEVAFEEIDVTTSERGKEDFRKLGAMGTPIMVVADTKIVGYDEGMLKDVLRSKGLWK